MRKINKIINMVVIVVLIGVVGGADAVYSLDTLRPPLISNKTNIGFIEAQNRSAKIVFHRNRVSKDRYILLPDRFEGKNVNFMDVLLRVLKQELGYVPLVSITGSASYAFTEQGALDWDVINDVDIRIHTKKKLSHNKYWSIYNSYIKALRDRGIPVRYVRTLYEKNGTEHTISLTNCELDFLFKGDMLSAGFQAYNMAAVFFGDLSFLAQFEPQLLIGRTSEYYEEILRLGGNRITYKTLYQLAYIRGKEEEFRWLLEAYKQSKGQHDSAFLRDTAAKAYAILKDTKDLEGDLQRVIKSITLPVVEIPQSEQKPTSNQTFVGLLEKDFPSYIQKGIPLQILDIGTEPERLFPRRLKIVLDDSHIKAIINCVSPDIEDDKEEGIVYKCGRIEYFIEEASEKHRYNVITVNAPDWIALIHGADRDCIKKFIEILDYLLTSDGIIIFRSGEGERDQFEWTFKRRLDRKYSDRWRTERIEDRMEDLPEGFFPLAAPLLIRRTQDNTDTADTETSTSAIGNLSQNPAGTCL